VEGNVPSGQGRLCDRSVIGVLFVCTWPVFSYSRAVFFMVLVFLIFLAFLILTSFSASAKSCNLPVAFLLSIKSSKEITFINILSFLTFLLFLYFLQCLFQLHSIKDQFESDAYPFCKHFQVL